MRNPIVTAIRALPMPVRFLPSGMRLHDLLRLDVDDRRATPVPPVTPGIAWPAMAGSAMWSILLLFVTNAVAPSGENTICCGCLNFASLMRATSFHVAASTITISFVLFTGTQTNLPSGVNTGSNAILPTSIAFTSCGFAAVREVEHQHLARDVRRRDERLAVRRHRELHERVRRPPARFATSTLLIRQRDARDLVHAEAAGVRVAAASPPSDAAARNSTSISSPFIVVAVDDRDALRRIHRAHRSRDDQRSDPGEREHARRLHLELADDLVLPIDLHDAFAPMSDTYQNEPSGSTTT